MLKSERDLKRLLYKYTIGINCECGGSDFWEANNFLRYCKKCNKKYSVTNNTIFHNVRFGLLQAFRIVVMEYENDFNCTSTQIAKDFNITQKTAYNFLKKIRANKEGVFSFIEFVNNNKTKPNKYQLKDEEKLNIFLKSIGQ